jgi:ADP-ribose pyrophosphatase YjhB (NUDIX family)
MPRLLPREEFDAIYGKVPRLTVEVLVRTPEGILLTRRGIEPSRGSWHIPGGTVLFAEPLHDAVRRVARNELEVEVEVGDQIGVIQYPELHAAGYRGWPVGLVFAARIAGGVPTHTVQSEQIGFFRTPPRDMIPDQAAFLASLGRSPGVPGAAG